MRTIGTPKLVELADALDAAATAVPSGDNATLKRMLGAWTRARRAYCDHTGEDLV